jgi:hypothetical protein
LCFGTECVSTCAAPARTVYSTRPARCDGERCRLTKLRRWTSTRRPRQPPALQRASG